MSLATCCCTQFDLYELYDCAETGPTVPRYMWARCDIYELETGQPKANCPVDWTPNPYIVWVIERPGCNSDLDYACGKFVEISTLEQPAAMTSNAVAAGYQDQFDPDLPVVNTCQYCPSTPCLPILGGPDDILAWLTVEDCCTDECAGTTGEPLGCDLITANCGLPWSTVANAGVFDASSTNGAFSDSLGTSTTITVSNLTTPSGWTITSNPNGSFGTYTIEAVWSFRLTWDGVLACFQPCPNTSASSTPINVSGDYTVKMRASCSVLSNTCNFGGNTTPTVSAVYTVTPADQSGYTLCGTSETVQFFNGGFTNDHLCNNSIRYGRTNLHRFVISGWSIGNTGWGVCPIGSGSTGAEVVIEAMTPLGDASDYGC